MDTEAVRRVSDAELAKLIVTIDENDSRGVEELERLLRDSPSDARLYFLKGMMLASWNEYDLARAELERAIRIAPEYWLARFQLGVYFLASGLPIDAQDSWIQLGKLPRNHYLRLFADGLRHSIREEYGEAARLISEGIRNNHEYVPLNPDMRRIVRKLNDRRRRAVIGAPIAKIASWLRGTQHDPR